MTGSLLLALALLAAGPPESDALYEALFGPPLEEDAGALLHSPGRFVGQAVTTRGRLARGGPGASFELAAPRGRILLRFEPQAAAVAALYGDAWAGRAVEAEGFFYREGGEGGEGDYALRAWRLQLAGPSAGAPPPASQAPLVTLADLAYGAGRHDGTLVRVRGSYRGANVHRDLPEASRKGARDWVLKDGHFAAWVGGREDPLKGSEGRSLAETDVALEVVGVPTTSNGVVRLAARAVEVSQGPPPAAIGRALVSGDAGWAAVPPRLSFAYPPPGQALRRSGRMILQFSKPMDPARFESGVRVRYERGGAVIGAPRLRLDYRDRYRALLVTPEPAPPPDADVVLELLDGLIDVDGRALAAPDAPVRFRSPR